MGYLHRQNRRVGHHFIQNSSKEFKEEVFRKSSLNELCCLNNLIHLICATTNSNFDLDYF